MRLRRTNPAAGLAALVWLLIVIVPVYVMVNASLMPQGEAPGGRLLGPAAHATLANYRLVLHSGLFHVPGIPMLVLYLVARRALVSGVMGVGGK